MANNTKNHFTEEEMQDLAERYLAGDTLSMDEQEVLSMGIRANPSLRQYMLDGVKAARSQTGGRKSTTGSRQVIDYRQRGNMNQNLLQRGSGYGGNRNTISPGGFKKSGMDADSQARMSGQITPDAIVSQVENVMKKGKDGKWRPTGEYKFNGRTYSRTAVDTIMRRAMTGATLSNTDQVIYDKIVSDRNRAAQAEAEAQKRRQEEDDMIRQQVAANRADLLKRQRDVADANAKELYKQTIEARLKRQGEADKIAAQKAEWDKINEREGIPQGEYLTADEYKLLQDGKHRYDYSPEAKRKISELESEMEKIIADPSISLDDLQALYRQEADIKARYGKRVQENPKSIDPKEELAIAEANGGYVLNDKGVPVLVEKPKEEKRQKTLEEMKAEADRNGGVYLDNSGRAVRFPTERNAAKDKYINDLLKDGDADGNPYTPQQVAEMAKRWDETQSLINGQNNIANPSSPAPVYDPSAAFADEAEEEMPQNNTPAVAPRFANDWRTMAANNAADPMAYETSACQVCGAALDENGGCTNPECPTLQQ